MFGGGGLRTAETLRKGIRRGAASRPLAPIHMEILAALFVREGPRDLSAGNLEEVFDVEGPDPNAAARAGRSEPGAIRAEGHAGNGAPEAR
jgi:hypothetical protein